MPTITDKTAIFLQASWNAPANIKTCITTSINDFNPATHVNDDPQNVINNRKLLRQLLPNDPVWLNQIHGTTIVEASHSNSHSVPDADASYSTQSAQVCVVMTADCLPILLSNQNGDFIAAIHAGWRGLNDGIIENTLTSLSRFKSNEMIAFIGPAICQECFEIGNEVKEAFIKNDHNLDTFFINGITPEKQHADLRGIAEYKLLKSGLAKSNISNKNVCTRCNLQWFYSYRANPNTGRIATLIWKT